MSETETLLKSAAFFDIDRTLVVGTSLESCFLGHALRHGLLGPGALWHNLWAGLQALHLLPAGRAGRFPIPAGLGLRTRLRYAFLSGNKAYLRGLSLERCRALAAQVFQQRVLSHLSRRGEALVQQHRSQGRLVVLLTGTLDFLGEPLQAHLHADALLAARPEVCEGYLTGRLRSPHPYGQHKVELLQQFARESGLDLRVSYAYADHHTDVPFLEATGHPVAVNPDPALADIARARGWPVEQF